IYMSAIDKDGNIVSLIQSNYSGYGTGFVAPGAGFSFHNRGAGFDLEPGKPNSLAGRKRPLHTIIPAFMRKGDLSIGFGIMGGWNQSQAHAQFVANVVDFNMNVQMALESARFTKGTFDGCDLQMETRVADAVRQELARRGHIISPVGSFSSAMGNGEAVMRDAKRGVNFGGADPRTDGDAISGKTVVTPLNHELTLTRTFVREGCYRFLKHKAQYGGIRTVLLLMIVGIVLLAAGLLFTVLGKLPIPFGRLPGDIRIQGKNSSFYFPLTTCLLVSVVLSLVMWLFKR